MTSRVFFNDNIKKHQLEQAQLSTLFNRISIIRISAVILGLVGIVYFANASNGQAATLVFVLLIFSFGILVKWHNRVRYARDHAGFLAEINRQEVARLDGDLSDLEGGEAFASSNHYYTSDLDVFGSNSLFSLLNRGTTIMGRSTLAAWLSSPATPKAIRERQKAVSELSELQEFGQNLEAIGLHFESEKVAFEPLMSWLEEPSLLTSSRWIKWASVLLVTTVILLGISAIFGILPYGYLLVVLLVNAALLKYVFKHSLKITEQTSQGVSTLSVAAQLILTVEKETFASPLLTELKSPFETKGGLVSTRIKKLSLILDFLNSRSNMFYAVINALFLADILLISLAESWKDANRDEVEKWFDNIGQIEALSSMGRFAFANANYTMPDIVEGTERLSAENLGHPLIPQSERVQNDFEIEGKGVVAIITGSNMSGKSTFLRTLGVNMTLALAGAPVCADRLSVSRFQVFTSMRTEDNLKEHISSFYAELKRIEQLLHLLKDNELPVLFMLDEILKGTNSEDRHRGALALVKQLHKTNATGFVSTHDLDLGKEVESYGYCVNYSFNSQVIDDEIIFDYRIEEGICHSFNASALMKKIGIDIP